MSSGLLDLNPPQPPPVTPLTPGLSKPTARPEPKPEPQPTPEAAPPRRLFDLLAIDIDGTLIRSDKRMNLQDVAAIKLAASAGVKVVLASARPPRTVREIYDVLELDTPQINYNGALVHDPWCDLNLLHRPLPGERVRDIIAMARNAMPEVIVHVEVLDRWYTDREDARLQTATSQVFPPERVGPLDPLFEEPITKLMLLGRPDRLAPVRQAVVDHFGRDITLLVSDQHLLQVAHPSVSKAMALAWVSGILGIQGDSVCAIGDAPNDIDMLQWAGLGLAVDNAWPETLHAADAIIPANDQSGVAQAIYRYVLEG